MLASKLVKVLCVFISIGLSSGVSAQVKTDLNEISLEDLLNVKVTVASGSKSKGLTTRESPSIVSVITADDIKKSGYRDMIDILRMVPGFSVQNGADNSFTLTPASRGIKVGEGKMLLLVNGFSFVDQSYVNVQVFNRFPVDQIRQIEIIRGPGSALYGGHAELTVIKIDLKDGADLNGSNVNALYSRMKDTYARQNLSYMNGGKQGDLSYSINTYFGTAELGDKMFTDEAGTTYRFDKNSGYSTKFVNVNNTFKNLTTRVLYSEYTSQSTDNYYVTGDPYIVRFTNLAASASYDIKAMEGKLLVTPSIDYNRNGAWNVTEPWNINIGTGLGNWNQDVFNQSHAKVNALYTIDENYDISGGLETEQNETQALNNTSGSPNTLLTKRMYFSNLGVYLQGTAKLGNLNITAGGRYEQTTASKKAALVPRLAITSVMDRFHFKLLASQAYRTPSGTQYIYQQGELSPETANVQEIEVGYKVSPRAFLTANIFNQKINGALRYDNLGYANTTSSGSKGFELEYKRLDSWGNLTATLSYYAATKRTNDAIASTLDEKASLGLPRMKYTLASTYNLCKDMSLNGQFIRDQKTYAFTDASFTEKELTPANIVNLYFLYQNTMSVAGLDVGFGIWNALDADIWFPTMQKNGQPPPLPGPDREYGLRVNYAF